MKIHVPALIVVILFAMFMAILAYHERLMSRLEGCTDCGATPETPTAKAILDIFNMPLHADDVSRAFTLTNVHGLSMAQIRGDGTL